MFEWYRNRITKCGTIRTLESVELNFTDAFLRGTINEKEFETLCKMSKERKEEIKNDKR